MYFIRVEGNEIVSVHDGSKDYVHRKTGTLMPGGVCVPDDAIPVSEADAQLLLKHSNCCLPTWDGTKVVVQEGDLIHKKARLLHNDRTQYVIDRRAELDLMTEAEIDSLLAAYGE